MSYFHLGAEGAASGLTVRVCRAPGAAGGAAVMLCDALGTPLPDQVECHLDNPKLDELGFVTAKFVIGKSVKLEA